MPATARKLLVSSEFTGNGVDVGEGGDGPITLATNGVTTTKMADGAITPIKLSGGVGTPAINTVYGRDAAGNYGFKPDPAGGGGSSETTVQLTQDEAVLNITYEGDSAPTFVETPAGTFTIGLPAGTIPKAATFVGTDASRSGYNVTLKFVSVDGRSTHFIETMLRMDTYERIAMESSGILPTQNSITVPGTTTCLFPNINYDSFQINMVFINSIIP